MRHDLTYDQVRNVTSYHEAGHAGLMVKQDIGVVGFRRDDDGTAQVIPDPKNKAAGIEGLYHAFLAVRASRYSQKLSPYNSPEVEALSFRNDDPHLEGQASRLYDMFHRTWGEDGPDQETFKQQLLEVADSELHQLYAADTYKEFITRIAEALIPLDAMKGHELVALVNTSWTESKADVQFTMIERFKDVCLQQNLESSPESD